MDAKPEIYSHRWYQEQLTGFDHLLKRLAAEYTAQYQRLQIVVERLDAMQKDAEKRDARIGELMAKIDAVESRVEKAAKVVSDMKAKANGK